MINSGIYQIRNIENGKVYVGQSIHIEKRIVGHFRLLRLGKHGCNHLQSAFHKYGEGVFAGSVIEKCSKELLTEREQYWMDYYKDRGIYNMAPAAGSNRGIKLSPETCAKMSKGMMGINKGKHHTAEALAKIRAAASMGKQRNVWETPQLRNEGQNVGSPERKDSFG